MSDEIIGVSTLRGKGLAVGSGSKEEWLTYRGPTFDDPDDYR